MIPRHETDDSGAQIHIDIDPFIATGVCAICSHVKPETEAPEDRPTAVE